MAALGTHPVARVTFDLWAAMWGLGKILPLSHIPCPEAKPAGTGSWVGTPAPGVSLGGA